MNQDFINDVCNISAPKSLSTLYPHASKESFYQHCLERARLRKYVVINDMPYDPPLLTHPKLLTYTKQFHRNALSKTLCSTIYGYLKPYDVYIDIGPPGVELFQIVFDVIPPTELDRLTSHAATIGNLDIIKLVHENGTTTDVFTTDAMDNAAENGHLEVVKWLHENRYEGCTGDAMICAAACGHLKVVKWLHENRDEGSLTTAMQEAVESDQFEIVKWLHESAGVEFTPDLVNTFMLESVSKHVKEYLETSSGFAIVMNPNTYFFEFLSYF